MIRTYRDLLSVLLPRERRRFYLLLCLATVSALFEAVSIASILPLLSVLANPSIISESGVLARAHDLAGAPDLASFQVILAVMVFLLIVVGIATKMATLYAMIRYSQMRNFSLSSRLLRGYLHQPYEFFLERHSAEIGRTVLYEVEEMIRRVLQPALELAASALVVFFIVLVLFVANPVTSIVVTAVLGLTYATIYLSVRQLLSRLGHARLEFSELRFRMAQEPIEGVKYVKLRGLEDNYVGRFRAPALAMARINAIMLVMQKLPRQGLELVGFGGILLFIITDLTRQGGELGQLMPTLGLVAFAGIRLLPALNLVFERLALLKSGEAILEQVVRDLGGSDNGGQRESAMVSPLPLTHTLELRDIRYTYPKAETPAVSDLTMEIPARSTIGIVGGTGAGKTTAVDLLLGLIEPQSGSILVDTIEINHATRPRWQRNLGYVPQTIFLTDDSLAANIAFGVPLDEIDMERVISAAHTAALHDFVISDLPQGYETHLGERGVRLSGGQRQRIGIARALYFDPDVLIFDEATSALDTLTERAVMDAIERLGGQKTIVMIAHRLSTVRPCDRIYLLEKGCVTASGQFDELSEKSATFREMVRHG